MTKIICFYCGKQKHDDCPQCQVLSIEELEAIPQFSDYIMLPYMEHDMAQFVNVGVKPVEEHEHFSAIN